MPISDYSDGDYSEESNSEVKNILFSRPPNAVAEEECIFQQFEELLQTADGSRKDPPIASKCS